jgi:hypothetical protein
MPAQTGNLRAGSLFEMGPDGYGYLIDQQEPGSTYAFHTSMLEGEFSGDPVQLEGAPVRYSLDKRIRVSQVQLLNLCPYRTARMRTTFHPGPGRPGTTGGNPMVRVIPIAGNCSREISCFFCLSTRIALNLSLFSSN